MGELAPKLALTQGDFDLARFQDGHPTLVVFCGGTMRSHFSLAVLKGVEQVREHLADQGLEVLGVYLNKDGSVPAFNPSTAEPPVVCRFPVMTSLYALTWDWRLKGTPSFFVLDSHQRVLAAWAGYDLAQPSFANDEIEHRILGTGVLSKTLPMEHL